MLVTMINARRFISHLLVSCCGINAMISQGFQCQDVAPDPERDRRVHDSAARRLSLSVIAPSCLHTDGAPHANLVRKVHMGDILLWAAVGILVVIAALTILTF
jgi:hypothetical protein